MQGIGGSVQPISQSRRSSSLKSYDPLSPSVLSNQFTLTNDLLSSTNDLLSSSSLPNLGSSSGTGGSALSSALSGVSMSGGGGVKSSSVGSTSSNKRQKKKQQQQNASNIAGSSAISTLAGIDQPDLLSAVGDDAQGDHGTLESPDWTFDPNEPRYCLCNQVSYGDMVACDNPRCPVEWFHYPCVNITAPPKGKWYCPQCNASMNRRQKK